MGIPYEPYFPTPPENPKDKKEMIKKQRATGIAEDADDHRNSGGRGRAAGNDDERPRIAQQSDQTGGCLQEGGRSAAESGTVIRSF